MPSRWVVPLTVGDPESVRLEHLHGLAAAWLDRVDGVEHAGNDKPWAISPLQPLDDGTCLWEIGLLDDGASQNPGDTPLVSALQDSIGRAAQIGLRLGRSEGGIAVGGGGARCVLASSWSDLAERARPRTRWQMRFLSPAFFMSKRVRHPLPVAGTVFGGLARRWRQWSTADLPEVDPREIGLAVDAIDGRSVEVDYRRGRVVGFVGEATFRVHGASREQRSCLDALAAVAPFSGVGAATTHGFGVVDLIVDPWEDGHREVREAPIPLH